MQAAITISLVIFVLIKVGIQCFLSFIHVFDSQFGFQYIHSIWKKSVYFSSPLILYK